MAGANSFLYVYLVDGTPTASPLTVDLDTGGFIEESSPGVGVAVSLAALDGSTELVLAETFYVNSPGYSGDTYTYEGLVTTGGVDAIVASFGPDYCVFSSQALPTGSLAFSSGDPYPVCFLRGTRILTPRGEVPVEDLVPGDLVVDAAGAHVPVRWIGWQRRMLLFAPEAWPVTIARGAIGEGVPHRDLHVSGDHALLVDGYLVNARALVNGMSVRPMEGPPEIVEYFHVELASHALVVAEGALAESFIDDVTRERFDNYQEWVDLGLATQQCEALDLPKVKSRRQLPQAVRRRMHARAIALDPDCAITHLA